VEIYVNVGRRDGARAADFQRVLTERAGIDRALVRRIRVRDRNAFVSVRREDLAKALASLQGASIAGKTAMAEQARERAGENEAAPAVSGEPATLTAGTSADAPPPVASSAPTPPAGIPVTPADEAITAPLAIEPPEPAIATASPEPGDQDDAVPTGRSAS
jgi:ATP-dependent RNA helicase DeaD